MTPRKYSTPAPSHPFLDEALVIVDIVREAGPDGIWHMELLSKVGGRLPDMTVNQFGWMLFKLTAHDIFEKMSDSDAVIRIAGADAAKLKKAA